jgi:tRNA-2-methylthio-N6-dimethylallyladenosine synthase
MNRSYTIDHYLRLVENIRRSIPGVSLTTDIISGFPTETDAEHQMTIDLLKHIRYDGAYTFKYSPRQNTKAWEMADDVADQEKGRRVYEITEIQHVISLGINQGMVGRIERILVEGASKKSEDFFTGRTDTNKTVIFPHGNEKPGDYIDVMIQRANSATLFGDRWQQEKAA